MLRISPQMSGDTDGRPMRRRLFHRQNVRKPVTELAVDAAPLRLVTTEVGPTDPRTWFKHTLARHFPHAPAGSACASDTDGHTRMTPEGDRRTPD